MKHKIKEQLKQFYKNPTSVQYEHHSSRGTGQEDMRVLFKLWCVSLEATSASILFFLVREDQPLVKAHTHDPL
jgi:hypothetical protein